jgi:hypothetical protein
LRIVININAHRDLDDLLKQDQERNAEIPSALVALDDAAAAANKHPSVARRVISA